MLRPKLVQDWHRSWRWFSVQFIAASATVQTALLAFPETLRTYLPEGALKALVVVLLLAAIVGRLVDQEKTNVDHTG